MKIGDRTFEITIKGARALALAISLQATEDWDRCCDLIEKRKKASSYMMTMTLEGAPALHKAEIETYFRSDFFRVIMEVRDEECGERVLEGLRQRRTARAGRIVKRNGSGKHDNHLGKSWRKLDGKPELQEMLKKNKICQEDMEIQLQVNATTLRNWMSAGLTEEQEKRIRKGAEEIIRRREKYR